MLLATLSESLKLTRPTSSLLGFLAIFLPFYVRSHDVILSLGGAIPVLFTCMCTFIANDLDDVEKDRVNHPERPLPSGHITPALATLLYFTYLGLALFATRYFVPPATAFWYYLLITAGISYGYVVEMLPGLKAPYVAATTTIPIIIVATTYPDALLLKVVAISVFFHTLGREICMDIEDRVGDAISFMHRFRATPLATVAFSLEAMSVVLLTSQARRLSDLVALLVLISLLVLSAVSWFRSQNYNRATAIMKLQFFVGLYFMM